VYLRNELRNQKPRVKECGIINLDNDQGTHWTAYRKNKNIVIYFDPFGIQPPNEVIDYFKAFKIYYTTEQIQDLNSNICGLLCLSFLKSYTI